MMKLKEIFIDETPSEYWYFFFTYICDLSFVSDIAAIFLAAFMSLLP